MTEERKANEATQEQNNATRAETSGQDQGRTFTQEEVNAIVRDRLAREREKAAPQTDEREQEISAREKAVFDRENLLACKEYVAENKYSERLLKLYSTENVDEFKANVERLIKTFPVIKVNPTGVTVQTQSDAPFQIVSTGASHGNGLPVMREDEHLVNAFKKRGYKEHGY